MLETKALPEKGLRPRGGRRLFPYSTLGLMEAWKIQDHQNQRERRNLRLGSFIADAPFYLHARPGSSQVAVRPIRPRPGPAGTIPRLAPLLDHPRRGRASPWKKRQIRTLPPHPLPTLATDVWASWEQLIGWPCGPPQQLNSWLQ
jgi:hypothetical protein